MTTNECECIGTQHTDRTLELWDHCKENEMMTWEQAEVQARKSFDEVGGISGLVHNIERIKARYRGFWGCGDETLHIDIRLNYQPEEVGLSERWSVNTGDSQYDQDYRGFWGCGSVGANTNARGLAIELLNQVLEEYASGREACIAYDRTSHGGGE